MRMRDLSPLSRHERIALSFSGGKDSTAVVYMLRDFLPRITVYWNNTGDMLPETLEIVEAVRRLAPNFVEIKSNARAWMAEHGMPSDLVPHSAHLLGCAMGEPVRVKLVSRYECCFANLMWPIYSRVKEDGCTLLIRGTKRVDMKRLTTETGTHSEDGIEFYYPLQDWTHQQVFDYLREQGAPISRIYEHGVTTPDCARCPAWWGEKRASYLKQYHPDLHRDYRAGLELVAGELAGAVMNLRSEMEA